MFLKALCFVLADVAAVHQSVFCTHQAQLFEKYDMEIQDAGSVEENKDDVPGKESGDENSLKECKTENYAWSLPKM